MTAEQGRRPGRGKRRALLVLFGLGALLFAALALWQFERLAWKRELIARVEARIHAEPIPAPGAPAWAGLDASAAEYTRLRARGRFLHTHETLVEALTERGPGWWVLTPLDTGEGVILVNRGFVPPRHRDPASRPAGQVPGEVVVVGLLRASEPRGRFLRPNDPPRDRWFSRDVAAIARARGVTPVAPYFIDAEASGPGALPIGGLTVVRFRNTHLVYALTWLALAGLCVAGVFVLRRGEGQAGSGGSR